MNSNSSNPPQLPDKLAGFDLEDGLQRMQGNQALYIKLIGKFASGFSTAGAEISQALADGDLEQTHALVHNLKGLAGNLSATRLFEAARTLDEAIKSNLDRATIEADLTTLNDALTEVLASAATVHPADSSYSDKPISGTNELSVDQRVELAGHIRQAVDLGDVMSLHEQADALPEGCSDAAKILELVDDFDFDGLLSLADELEQRAE